jgi:uncharacterized protein (TIGR03067 family)
MAVLAMVCCVSGSVAYAAQAPSLVGTWEVLEAVRKSLPPQEMRGATVTFNADQTFSIDRPERSSWSGTYRVDAKAGTVDLAFRGKNLTRPHEGDVWEGIYRFHPDGRLEINTAQGLDARPVDFLSGYDLTLMTLKRKK